MEQEHLKLFHKLMENYPTTHPEVKAKYGKKKTLLEQQLEAVDEAFNLDIEKLKAGRELLKADIRARFTSAGADKILWDEHYEKETEY